MGDKERAERFCSPGLKGISLDDGRCAICKHVSEDGQSCDAFPERIPSEILHGMHDHSEPFPGDGGILFERISQ